MTHWEEDPFDFGAERFDSRDVNERIAYLADKADDVGLNEDEQFELDILNGLRDDTDHRNFDSGMTFVNDEYFQEYARELARDIGAINDDMRWPATCIDWKEAAEELKMDYTAFNVNGITFWANDV